MATEKAKSKSTPEEPELDPYVALRRQYKALVERVDKIEDKQANLQVTWDRLLNISYEPPLIEHKLVPLVPEGEPIQPVEQPHAVWEDEKVKEAKPKKRFGIGTIILFIGVVAILAIGFLWSQGWSCAIPALLEGIQ